MNRIAFCAVATLAACVVPYEGPNYKIEWREELGHLKNGVHVVLLPDDSAPLVEVDVRYDVGSKEDPEGRAGLAHLVEHLMFQGRQAGPEQPSLGAVLRASAVFYNAYTNWDTTHYMVQARKEELPTLLALEAARLANGCDSITDAIFLREREVVRNEIRQRNAVPEARLANEILGDLYPAGHPYARSIGGDDAQLLSITREEACKFMRDHYVPERATLIIAGDFKPAEAQGLIAGTLGTVAARPGAALREVPPVTLARKRVTREVDAEDTSVVVAWALPPEHGKEDFAIPYIIGIVAGRTAAMDQRYEFASQVYPVVVGGARAPVLAVHVTLDDKEDVDEAVNAVFRAAGTAHWGMKHADFELQRASLLLEVADGLESLSARTNTYGDYAQFDPQGGAFNGQVQRLAKLEGKEVGGVVSRTLDKDKAMVLVLKGQRGRVGSTAAALAQPVASARRDELPIDGPRAALPLKVPEHPTVLGRARRFQLGNGMRVVMLKTDAPLPMITGQIVYGVGRAHEPRGQRGVAEIAGYGLAGWGDKGLFPVDAAVGTEATRFRARTVSLYPKTFIQDFDDQVRGYRRDGRTGTLLDYSQEAIEARARHLRAQERRLDRRAARAVDHALGAALWGEEHPYAGVNDIDLKALGSVGRDAARGFASRHFSARNATLIVTGVFDEAKVEGLIREHFGAWPGGDATPPVAPPTKPAAAAVIGVVGPDLPQLQVRLAFPTPPGIDEAHAARLVLAEMLDRRASTVREGLGATYGMNAFHEPRLGGGRFVIAGAVDAARGGESLAALRRGIDELRRGEGFLEDFVHARDAVLARELSNASDSDELAERLAQIAMYGLAPDFADDLVRRVARLTPRDVLVLARKELDPAHEVLVVGGGRKPLSKAFTDAKLTPANLIDATD